MSKVKQEPREQETRDILYTQQAGPRPLVVLNFWSWNSMQVLQPTTWEEELSSVWSSLSLVRKKESFRSGVQRAQSTWGGWIERKSEEYAHIGTVTVISSDRQHYFSTMQHHARSAGEKI